MRLRTSRVRAEQDPFTDLLFNVLLTFTFLFIVALIFLHPPTEQGNVKVKAEIIVAVTWEELRPDDLDLWMEDPEGNVVYFNNPSAGLMHLDRDDRGNRNDFMLVDGREIVNPLNQEVITVRGNIRGEYVVNVHYYESTTNEPVKATVTVSKVNPVLEVAYHGEIDLPTQGTEVTAVRFTTTDEGTITNINTRPKSLVTLQ